MAQAVDTKHVDWGNYFYHDPTSPSGLRHKYDKFVGSYSQILALRANTVAGALATNGYYVIKYNHRQRAVHRIIYEMMVRRLEVSEHIDHIDGNITNNNLSNLRVVGAKLNCRNMRMSTSNSSGVVGVRKMMKEGVQVGWVATWRDAETGKQRDKSFSVNRYGNDNAYKMALSYRKYAIDEANKNGAGYTGRHGKRKENASV